MKTLRTASLVAGALLFAPAALSAPSDGGAPPARTPDAGTPSAQNPGGTSIGPVVRPDGGPDVSDNPHGMQSQPGAMGAEVEPETPSPHAKAQGGQLPNGMFQPPEDGSVDDRRLPIGTLDVMIADPDGKPIPGMSVTLGILFNSVAKGESRKRILGTTNAQGIAHYEGLDTGSTVAYRPMVVTDDATFSNMPFRLSDKTGTRAILHVYPTESDVEKSMVVTQTIVYAEVKDDRIQIQEAFKIYNFGRTAWTPKDLVIGLPEAFTAFNATQGMSDTGVDAVEKKGVKLRGTFGPGQQMIEFRWQLPYKGEASMHFDIGTPPHTAAARVIAPASRDMKLEVEGFPPPQPITDEQGQRSLVTEKQLRRDEALLKSVTVDIKNLPTEGPAKIVATLLAACGIGLGLVLGTRRPGRHDRKAERDRILAELADLEKAHLDGDVGPKTYERARRELLDALARTFSVDAPPAVASVAAPKKKRV